VPQHLPIAFLLLGDLVFETFQPEDEPLSIYPASYPVGALKQMRHQAYRRAPLQTKERLDLHPFKIRRV
jgi:hypothetical protein